MLVIDVILNIDLKYKKNDLKIIEVVCRGGRIRTCGLPAWAGRDTFQLLFKSSKYRLAPLFFIFFSSKIASLLVLHIKVCTSFQGMPYFVDNENPELCRNNRSSISEVCPM